MTLQTHCLLNAVRINFISENKINKKNLMQNFFFQRKQKLKTEKNVPIYQANVTLALALLVYLWEMLKNARNYFFYFIFNIKTFLTRS